MGVRRTFSAPATLKAGVVGRSRILFSIIFCTLLVGLLGLTVHPRLLLLVPSLLVVLVAGVGWPWFSVLFLRGRLQFEKDRVHEHENVEASLTIEHRAPWPAWGLVLDAGKSNQRALQAVRPLAAVDSSFTLQPRRRGAFPERAPRIRTGFPFGLLTATRKIVADRSVVVWPRVLPVAMTSEWASADQVVGHVETRRIGSEGDTIGVREYRRGDPMRWIHWSQTARHDRFMVREFQACGIPRVRILLDCDAAAHVGVGSDSSFEWSVRIAASLAAGWLMEGAEVELLAGTRRLPAAGGQLQRRRILDALAEVELTQSDRDGLVPASELASVFVGTELGWHNRQSTPSCAWRGFLLSSDGFGGDERPSIPSHRELVVIEGPEQVATALMRVKRGLADVA